MVNQLFRASVVFPIHFQDNTDAKIYFFVLVNKALLFEDSISLQISGDSPETRQAPFLAAIAHKWAIWHETVQNLVLTLGCEISLVMQGLKTKSNQAEDCFTPFAQSSRPSLGWSLGGSGFGGGGLIPPDQIPQNLKHWLVTHGIPTQTISRILNEVPDLQNSFQPTLSKQLVASQNEFQPDFV
jgi:hypothetical protein